MASESFDPDTPFKLSPPKKEGRGETEIPIASTEFRLLQKRTKIFEREACA